MGEGRETAEISTAQNPLFLAYEKGNRSVRLVAREPGFLKGKGGSHLRSEGEKV